MAYFLPSVQNFTENCQTLSSEDYQSYYKFIAHENKVQRDKHASANQFASDFEPGLLNQYISHVDDREERQRALDIRVSRMKRKQINAFNQIAAKLETGGFSLSFISGGGGVGKSYLLRQIQEHCLLKFGKTRGFFGPSLAVAPTGNASNNIGGYTWQSALKKGVKQKDTIMTQDTANLVGKDMEGVRLLIMDEVSMMSCKDISEIEDRVKQGM